MLIAGNWKMNTDAQEAQALISSVVDAVGSTTIDVAVCPPFVNLGVVNQVLSKAGSVALGAQNMHAADSGAYTGEISAGMLNAIGCTYVIIGHSERRQYFGETDKSVNEKVTKALASGLVPILCVGETLEEREGGREEDVVRAQVMGGLEGISINAASELVLAYEPVWAIGTGKTASPEQAQEIHAFIRSLLSDKFGAISSDIPILYGGSMKPGNAPELLSKQDVNGGLIGGASLKADAFAGIVRAGEAAV
ncbi:MAG: triose-phosphate isomerase [Rhodothermales bacterium]